MRIYACRWENGDLSFVAARSKEEAVLIIDEVCSVDVEHIREIKAFGIHLSLEDDGRFVAEDFSEGLEEEVMFDGYPALWDPELDRRNKDSLLGAVRAERERDDWGRPRRSDTVAGQMIQDKLGCSASVADAIAHQAAKRRRKG